MKKLLCAASLALSLAACGAQAADTNTNTTEPVAGTLYSLKNATVLTFTDSGITAQDGSDTGYEIDGTALTITGAGTYAVTGTCADGSITVKKGTTGVTLVLNGLALTSADTAPITCNKSTQVTIAAAEGSVNSLTDSAENNDDEYPDNEAAENAVIKCKDGAQVTLCGGGALTINANGKNGIKSGASTTASLTIRELTLTINAPVNDAINAQQLLNVESGTLTISAADDAIHSDLVLNIGGDGTDGPTIAITECCEGLEAAELNVLSGNIDILSSDDCLNAANSDLSGYTFSMNISGGIITACSSSGDGFDSNGNLTISGGTVAVWTANTADNQPLDADGAITVSGGTVLAAGGSAGMGMNLTAEQPCVTFGSTSGMGGGRPGDMDGGSAGIAKDAAVTITGSDGSAVYSGTALCNASFVFFSSPELTADGSYTLTAGDTTLTTAAQTGSISSGGMGGPGNGGQFPGDRDGGQPPQLPDGQQAPDFSGGGQPPERPGSQQPDTTQNS